MVQPGDLYGSIGTKSDPLTSMRAYDGAINYVKYTSDPPNVSGITQTWMRWDQDEYRYYDPNGNLGKVPLQSSAPSSPYLNVTNDDGTVRYINLKAKANADHPHLPVDGAIGSGLAMTGAVGGGTIDTFDDGDTSEYLVRNDDGNEQIVTTVSSPAVSGESLEISDKNDSGGSKGIYSIAGLSNYPQPGDRLTLRVRYEDTISDPTFQFHGANLAPVPRGYRAQVKTSSGELRLRKATTSGTSNLDTAAFSAGNYTGEFLELIVDWGSGGAITVTLDDNNGNQIAQVNATDTTYQSAGSIGLFTQMAEGDASDNRFYIDDIQGGTASSSGLSYSTIDDFADGDISEYAGDTGGFTLNNIGDDNALKGAYTLETMGAGNTITSDSGLSNYPSAGDTFQYFSYFTGSSGTSQFVFAHNGNAGIDDDYLIAIDANSSALNLNRHDNGSLTTVKSGSASVTTGKWLRTRVDWGASGSFTIRVFQEVNEVGSITATDSTYSSGGIGFRGETTIYEWPHIDTS